MYKTRYYYPKLNNFVLNFFVWNEDKDFKDAAIAGRIIPQG